METKTQVADEPEKPSDVDFQNKTVMYSRLACCKCFVFLSTIVIVVVVVLFVLYYSQQDKVNISQLQLSLDNDFKKIQTTDTSDELRPFVEAKLVQWLEMLNNKTIDTDIKTRSMIIEIVSKSLEKIKKCIKYHEQINTSLNFEEKSKLCKIIPIEQILHFFNDLLVNKSKNSDYFISAFCINFLLEYIGESIRNSTYLLNCKANNGDKNVYNFSLPQAGNIFNHKTNKHEEKLVNLMQLQIIDSFIIKSLFKLLKFSNILSHYQMTQLFHVFVRILPFLRYYKSNSFNTAQFESNRLMFKSFFNDSETVNNNNNMTQTSDSHVKKLIQFLIDFMLCKFTLNEKTPPGLTKSEHELITQHYTLVSDKVLLQQIQINIIQFLLHIGANCQFISKQLLYIPAIIGSYNGCGYQIQDISMKLFDKIAGSNEIDFQDSDMISKVIKLCIGSSDTDSKSDSNEKNTNSNESSEAKEDFCHRMFLCFALFFSFVLVTW